MRNRSGSRLGQGESRTDPACSLPGTGAGVSRRIDLLSILPSIATSGVRARRKRRMPSSRRAQPAIPRELACASPASSSRRGICTNNPCSPKEVAPPALDHSSLPSKPQLVLRRQLRRAERLDRWVSGPRQVVGDTCSRARRALRTSSAKFHELRRPGIVKPGGTPTDIKSATTCPERAPSAA